MNRKDFIKKTCLFGICGCSGMSLLSVSNAFAKSNNLIGNNENTQKKIIKSIDMENNKKTKWINTILSELDKVENIQSHKIIESCGRECLNSSDVPDKIDTIRKNIKDKNDINLLFKMYREKVYNNSPRLYMENDVIYLRYEECGCEMVKNGGVTNPFLCNCTRGYTKAIFEKLFDRQVDVLLKKSILRGDQICEQEIRII